MEKDRFLQIFTEAGVPPDDANYTWEVGAKSLDLSEDDVKAGAVARAKYLAELAAGKPDATEEKMVGGGLICESCQKKATCDVLGFDDWANAHAKDIEQVTKEVGQTIGNSIGTIIQLLMVGQLTIPEALSAVAESALAIGLFKGTTLKTGGTDGNESTGHTDNAGAVHHHREGTGLHGESDA